jgi:Ca-activated chloride channel homolog
MSFARPDLLFLVLLAPLLLAAAVLLHGRRRRRIAGALGEPRLLARLGGDALLRFPVSRLLLVPLAGACLALAAAGPQWGFTAVEGRAQSLNIVLAADVSKSMLAPDLEPNRLERARLFTRRLLRELPGDRFGLVAFAGHAYVLSPLTVDHSALQLYIDALDPHMMSEGGSSIAAALNQASDLVRASDAAGDRVVVLLTDGEDNAQGIDAVRAAADRTARAGVRVIAVGIGTTRGSTIPEVDPVTGLDVGVVRDEYGEVVLSRLDEDALRMIASRTGGSYVRLDDAGAVGRVVAELHGLQRGAGDQLSRLQPRDRFALFVALALLLLALDALIAVAQRSRRTVAGVSYAEAPVPGSEAAAAVAASADAAAAGGAAGGSSESGGRRGTGGRRGRAAALVAVLAVSLGFGIGDIERGNRLYREGRYEEAVEAYQRALDAGRRTPELRYNLGTALLALGRFDEAEQHLQTALEGVDPELRRRSFYNLGNRFLLDGRAEQDLQRQGGLLDAAIEAYRRALRLAPADVQAKWNLELALRDREENEQQQQQQPQQQDQDPQSDQDDEQQRQDLPGAGSAAGQAPSQAGEGADPGSDAEERPMSREQADRILSAIEQDERELAREKLQRGQRRTPVLRDW